MSSGQSGERRPVTRIVEDAMSLMENLAIDPDRPLMADKKTPGTSGRPVKLQSNIYGLVLPKLLVHRYDVNVFARLGDREVLFTKRSKEDAIATDRKSKCRQVFELVVSKYPAFFEQPRAALFYDCQSILYTVSPIPRLEDKTCHELNVTDDDLAGHPTFSSLTSVALELKKVSDNFSLDLGEMSHLRTELVDQDHSLQQFLELLTSQHALFTPEDHICYGSGTSFLINHAKYGFRDDDCPPLGEGKYLAVGSHKSVRFVEGPHGRDHAHAAVVVDTKKAAFHICQNLVEKSEQVLGFKFEGRQLRKCDIDKLRAQLKDVFVTTGHGRRPRTFPIASVTDESASNKVFQIPDDTGAEVQVTLAEYFAQKYNTVLSYPDVPLIMVNENKQVNYYPMEVCFVNDNQRVALSQQTPLQIQKMIRSCATPPAQRVRQNKENMRALELHSGNQYLKAAQVKISDQPLVLKGRILPTPDIIYGNNVKIAVATDKGSWRTDRLKPQFLVPADIGGWCVYVVGSGNRDILDKTKFMHFIGMYIQECRSRGIQMKDPADYDMISASAEDVKSRIIAAAQCRCYFVYFITSDAVTDIHKIMKLAERQYGVITQDMKMSSANDVVAKGKRQTLENVVNKTNIKNGGINYGIRITDPGKKILPKTRLFIGFAMSHPAPQTTHERIKGIAPKSPSVIGFAANMKQNPVDFVGDCVFQEPRRDEKIGVIRGVIESIVRRFHAARGFWPEDIVIYRNGSSEGQYPLILKYEVPLIRAALNELGCAGTKVTMIVSQKMHNVRIALHEINSKDRAPDQNIKPGTVVDEGAVHPVFNEFYLNSHVSLQGTAKTPRYTVLKDESGFEMNDLEEMTYALAYGHQIVTLATSLPAPAYIASRYADRGRNLYNASSTAWNTMNDGQLDYRQITQELAYSQSDLAEYRVNA